MAKSKAKKLRNHATRNGKFNVELKRGSGIDISLHERKLPTLKEKRKKEHKKIDQLANKYLKGYEAS
jgi:hypothetical protein